MEFKNKVVIVARATSGIGLLIAQRLQKRELKLC